jgi:hypothetical protein
MLPLLSRLEVNGMLAAGVHRAGFNLRSFV